MSLRIRRGLEADRLGITPDEGELLYITDTQLVYIGDGSTAGGILVTGSGSSGTSVPIATAGGTADAITATYTPPLTLTDKMVCAVVLGGVNTITNPTFAPDGLTAHTITKNGGLALVVGDLPGSLAVVILEYNLANTRWEIVGIQGDTLLTEGALINSATSKGTPVDADYVGLMDSAAANILKKLSWLNIKATLKTYFDTIYAALASPTFTGTVTTPAIIVSSETASRVAIIDVSKNVKSADTTTYPSLTELSYGKGVTSPLQPQLDSKGYSVVATFSTTSQAPADGATYYFGSTPRNSVNTTAGSTRIYITRTGTIKSCYLFFNQIAGSSETSTFSIRLNNTTDYVVSSAVTNDATQTIFTNTSLSIAVVAGDYIEGKWGALPSWVTNPTAVLSEAIIGII